MDIEGEEICSGEGVRLLEDYKVVTGVDENLFQRYIEHLQQITDLLPTKSTTSRANHKGAPPDIPKYLFVYLCDQFSKARGIKPFTGRQLALLASEMRFGDGREVKFSTRGRRWTETASKARGKRGIAFVEKMMKELDRLGLVEWLKDLQTE